MDFSNVHLINKHTAFILDPFSNLGEIETA